MKKIYFTIAGMRHYFGSDFLERGDEVKLIKEPVLFRAVVNCSCVKYHLPAPFNISAAPAAHVLISPGATRPIISK